MSPKTSSAPNLTRARTSTAELAARSGSATPARHANVPTALDRAAQALMRRFRSRRPVRGGSLLITVFGDAIAPRGGIVTLGSLIRLAAPFGLTERLVRTSVGRLAQDGWLIARRDGRRSEYRLTPYGQQSFAQATRRIYAANPSEWTGQWTLLLWPAPRVSNTAARRDRLRQELRWLGFGQIAAGLFLHPGCTAEQARGWLRDLEAPEELVLLTSSSETPAADRRLVAAGWNLAELARRYRAFVEAFIPIQTALELSAVSKVRPVEPAGMPDHEVAFVIRTLLIHEYRRVHLQDPLLPLQLLPDHWIGASAYELCSSLYGRVFAAAEEYLSQTASTLREPLPAAGREAYTRFGGIR
ncbi:MAG TPA: PaaX family transcriptional regulator C-terminal domain-containing protein [Steroidobacteraceae bacterium]|nr:PaaX family transcriptional regulator C-terminal domain-containing protein [Steroidobacteraceae bacterium]